MRAPTALAIPYICRARRAIGTWRKKRIGNENFMENLKNQRGLAQTSARQPGSKNAVKMQ
jgi:hypothetical protein